jgi:L-alanine-DL-glutamate epimerase-like enolase superfamily enzyme
VKVDDSIDVGHVDEIVSTVTAVPLAIPLNTPLRFSTREVSARQYVLVQVRTAGGLEGVGYTYAGTSGARACALFIEEVLAPLLVGQRTSPERAWPTLYQEILMLGRRGLGLRALSAVDIALWDLVGKAAGLPLYAVLGGHSDVVPAYGSGGYYRPGDPLKAVEQELEFFQDKGFRDFKIKVGGAPFDVDVERVRVARATIGAAGRLGLDANNVWATPADGIRFMRAVERYEPWWIEEPLSPDDIPGHAEIARTLDIPVATGEIHSTRWDFRDIIVAKAADILQPDANVLGGIGEWMKVAHTAQSFNLVVAPHWNADVHVHLAGAVSNCLAVEYFALEQDIFNVERLWLEPLEPRDGLIEIPKRPGLGLMVDWAAVEKYKLS